MFAVVLLECMGKQARMCTYVSLLTSSALVSKNLVRLCICFILNSSLFLNVTVIILFLHFNIKNTQMCIFCTVLAIAAGILQLENIIDDFHNEKSQISMCLVLSIVRCIKVAHFGMYHLLNIQ